MIKIGFVVCEINRVVGTFCLKGKNNVYYTFEVVPTSWLNSGFGTDCIISSHIGKEAIEFKIEGGIYDVELHMIPDVSQIQVSWDEDIRNEYDVNMLNVDIIFN